MTKSHQTKTVYQLVVNTQTENYKIIELVHKRCMNANLLSHVRHSIETFRLSSTMTSLIISVHEITSLVS